MIYFFEFLYIVDFVNAFSYIETTLNPWDEAYLLMVKDGFDMLLDSVCKNFIEYFCIDIYKLDWLECSFLMGSLCHLSFIVIVALYHTQTYGTP